MLIALALVYNLPPVQQRLAWRFDIFATTLRMALQPAGDIPTPAIHSNIVHAQALATETPLAPQAIESATLAPTSTAPSATPTAEFSPTPTPTEAPTLTPTPIPASVDLEYPPFSDPQDWNNCGPATLALYLRYYGWEGDQHTISDVIKPIRGDRNVNVDELLRYVFDNINWLYADFHVGGSVDMLRQIIATGTPVMIEESFWDDQSYWSNDDRWAGHYLLVTGYNDATQLFTVQDSFRGPNKHVPYNDLDKSWQSFNRVYFLLYKPELADQLKSILGPDWDHDSNRQNALDAAREETVQEPTNPYAWFNLGTNLVYFERYDEAADAYDKARSLRLPQRILRYQFGPFIAYFHTNRNDDLLALTEYALKITPNSEEDLLWRGWALYRDGDKAGAIEQFNKALEAHAGYSDAEYALNFVTQN